MNLLPLYLCLYLCLYVCLSLLEVAYINKPSIAYDGSDENEKRAKDILVEVVS